MKTVDEIRRDNLLLLIQEAGSAARLAVLTEVPAPVISQVKNAAKHSAGRKKPRVMGPDVARRLETKMGKPKGWMDVDHSALSLASDLNGREGQMIGLFRLLNDFEQTDLINRLTEHLRKPSASSAETRYIAPPPPHKH